MSQIIYALLALALVMILGLNLQRGISRTTEDQTLNEVITQLPGVGTEVLEQIGRTHFDWHTWQYGVSTPTRPLCGRVRDDRQSLLSEPDPAHASSTMGDCADFATCPYIEGFYGLDTTIVRGDFEYAVHVDTVRYVDPTNYATPSATQTFAKAVQITVTNPYLYVGDLSNTFSLTMERVFTYGCVTDPNKIPYVRQTESCPPMPLCSVSP